jgi:protein-S-isoprenylcysteine O-methyltransferase Ste14
MDLGKAARDPWVWGQFALFAAVAGGIPLAIRHADPASLLGRLVAPSSPAWRLPAILVLALGASVAIWGLRSLGKNLTPGTEPLASAALVRTGAYTFVRHPIYLGIILILWGLAWGFSNPATGLLAFAVSFFYFDRKAAVEEQWMAQRFSGYAAYRRQVPKLLPRLRQTDTGPAS